MVPRGAVEAIGYVAAAGTTFSLVPQIARIWRRREARDVSYGMFWMFSLGVALWLVYGVMVGSWPVVVANGVTLVFSVVVLVLKRRFG